MAAASILSVNRGQAADLAGAGKSGRSAIDKRPVAGPVRVGSLGLDGDMVVDTDNHGGPDQAVYVYAREDLDFWAGDLGRELASGTFGENVTTVGIDVSAALIGEIWLLGSAVVQITGPRVPCATFRAWLEERGWVKRFAAAGRPGAYLRVLIEGSIMAGDGIAVLSRPATEVTVSESMRAYYGDREIMQRLLQVEGRGSKWDKVGESVLSRS